MDTKDKKVEVVYYSDGCYSSFVLNQLNKIKKTDFLIFNFGVLPEISLDKEMSKETFIFKELAQLSNGLAMYVIAAAQLKIGNKVQKVALVFNEGKLLTISEYVGSAEKAGGASVNFFDTSFGRIGIFLLDNSYSLEFYQLAAVYDVGLIFSLTSEGRDKLSSLCAMYANDCYDVNVIMLGKKYIKAYCEKNKVSRGQKLNICSVKLKNSIKAPQFLKHIHKTIYTKLNN